MQKPTTLAATAKGLDRWLGIGLIASFSLLLIAYVAPLMTVRKVYLFSETFSLLGTLISLLTEQEWGLSLILILFSFVFPIAKIGLAIVMWFILDYRGKFLPRILFLVERTGKWSMLDVLIVALIIVGLKASFITDVAVHPGIYLFAGSLILSMIITARINALMRRQDAQGLPKS